MDLRGYIEQRKGQKPSVLAGYWPISYLFELTYGGDDGI
jgi:hypothetical protein